MDKLETVVIFGIFDMDNGWMEIVPLNKNLCPILMKSQRKTPRPIRNWTPTWQNKRCSCNSILMNNQVIINHMKNRFPLFATCHFIAVFSHFIRHVVVFFLYVFGKHFLYCRRRLFFFFVDLFGFCWFCFFQFVGFLH